MKIKCFDLISKIEIQLIFLIFPRIFLSFELGCSIGRKVQSLDVYPDFVEQFMFQILNQNLLQICDAYETWCNFLLNPSQKIFL